MSSSNALVLDDISNKDTFPLVRPTLSHKMEGVEIGYTLQIDTQYNDILIPKGFDYDGATIPQIFWSITGGPYDPRHMKATLLHDWLYLTKLRPKEVADKILFDVLLQSGKVKWQAEAFVWAVNTPFGGSYYRRSVKDWNYLHTLIAMVHQRGLNPDVFGLKDALLK